MRPLAAFVLVVSLTGALAGCSQDAEVATQPSSSETPTAQTSPSQTEPDASAESVFLAANAAHLCDVQSAVFEDPAELAAAYALAPEYVGLSEGQVADLTARLAEDAAFSAQLRTEIAETCG